MPTNALLVLHDILDGVLILDASTDVEDLRADAAHGTRQVPGDIGPSTLGVDLLALTVLGAPLLLPDAPRLPLHAMGVVHEAAATPLTTPDIGAVILEASRLHDRPATPDEVLHTRRLRPLAVRTAFLARRLRDDEMDAQRRGEE